MAGARVARGDRRAAGGGGSGHHGPRAIGGGRGFRVFDEFGCKLEVVLGFSLGVCICGRCKFLYMESDSDRE